MIQIQIQNEVKKNKKREREKILSMRMFYKCKTLSHRQGNDMRNVYCLMFVLLLTYLAWKSSLYIELCTPYQTKKSVFTGKTKV